MPRQRAETKKKTASTTGRRCGLCAKSRALTLTPCCDLPICDDVDNYVLFSYAPNSCFRNHSRNTLCGKRIPLGEGGYTLEPTGEYYCDACS